MREEHYESRTENDEKLAQSHLQYKRALEKLYRQILKFQAVICCYYSKQSAVRLGLDVIKQNDWDQLVNEVNNRENAFLEMKRIWGEIQYEKDRKEVRNDQRMAMSGIDSQLTASRKAFEATAFQKKYMELLDWLCNVDASSIYNTARNKHEEGTCEWLVNDSEDFRTWDTSPTSLMWLHGKGMFQFFTLIIPTVYLSDQKFCLICHSWFGEIDIKLRGYKISQNQMRLSAVTSSRLLLFQL
jgi:hypothetical protein